MAFQDTKPVRGGRPTPTPPEKLREANHEIVSGDPHLKRRAHSPIPLCTTCGEEAAKIPHPYVGHTWRCVNRQCPLN